MIQNPTMDAKTFARQFARIKERDAERASRARIAPVSAETEAPRAKYIQRLIEQSDRHMAEMADSIGVGVEWASLSSEQRADFTFKIAMAACPGHETEDAVTP